jgi:acyl-CoA synthetase (AMP-forming)/AMP-acid ligase II
MVARLNALGIGRNDRVAIILPNGPEMASAFLSVAAGATTAPLNPAYRAEEFDFFLGDLDAKALVIASTLQSPARVVAAERQIPIIELVADGPAGAFVLDGAPEPQMASAAGSDAMDFAEAGDIALVLHTSGTTSRPKQVPLTHANLCASARHIGARLELGATDRCLNIMPLFHIHGLMAAVLSSLAAGGSVVCTPGLALPDFFAWQGHFNPTWYTAVPTMHHAILAAAEGRDSLANGTLRFIRSSSSALPRQTLMGLERTFGVPVIEAYGMTEAAHQMASNPLPPRARKPGSVGIASGPDVSVMDSAGALLQPGETGEVVIRGPNVTAGYFSNPAANAAAFTNGWFRTGDQGMLDEDGYLFLNGRLKELINRGGEKISPVEIDEVLRDHAAVAQALTFALPHPTLGEDVAAAVVLRTPEAATERQLREFVSTRLAYFKVPRRIVFLDAIPKGPTGKPQRIGLADRLGIGPFQSNNGDRHAPIAPRNPLEEILAVLWTEVLRDDTPGVHDNFFDAGGDSILATQFVARVRDALNVELSLLDFFDGPTVAELALVVASQLGPAERATK